jgi:hypothetical protein
VSGLPKCGSCGAFIRWVVTVDGRRIPLDLAPDEGKASIWVDPETDRAHFLSKEKVAAGRAKGYRMDSIHHSTCPSVERHRVPRAQTSLDLFGDAA